MLFRSRIVATVGFGAIWTSAGSGTALAIYAAGLAVALGIAAVSFLRMRGVAGGEPVAA